MNISTFTRSHTHYTAINLTGVCTHSITHKPMHPHTHTHTQYLFLNPPVRPACQKGSRRQIFWGSIQTLFLVGGHFHPTCGDIHMQISYPHTTHTYINNIHLRMYIHCCFPLSGQQGRLRQLHPEGIMEGFRILYLSFRISRAVFFFSLHSGWQGLG